MNKLEFKEFLEKHAKENDIAINEETVDKLIDTEFEIEKSKGKKYCPCRALMGNDEEDDKKVCPCVWHLDEVKKDGHCLCNLFVRK